MVSREKIHERVKLFYQHTFKTFYINSEDGKEFSKPLGVFVSLGMTTKLKTLENIRDFISANKDFKAKIVEISSKRVDDQFLNTLVETENPQQYRIEELPDNIISREEAYEELEKLKNEMNLRTSLEDLTEKTHQVKKLKALIDNLEETRGWDSHAIQRDGDSDYRIFHLFVNYAKKEGVEFRLGIFVDENDDI